MPTERPKRGYDAPPVRAITQDGEVYLSREDVATLMAGYSDFLEQQLTTTGRNNHKPHQAVRAMGIHVSKQGEQTPSVGYTVPVSSDLDFELKALGGRWVAIENGSILKIGRELSEVKYEGEHPILWKVVPSGRIRI